MESVKSDEMRNWLDFPRDMMISIFLKLGVEELLFPAQFVCASWRKLAKESCLSLGCLRLQPCEYVTDAALVKLVENTPFLEELELSLRGFTAEIGVVSRSCPLLKSFQLGRDERT
ncbi:hypothetical protein IFM89_006459 [Coptis chinensis]|uniref:F-box domain-containing protein n=1 Tax=Coptis chinensis TaxID=261450 RepID=A0A835IMK2_9MAGN|nr:hypothetical protein IFM89_006459 [Coptis chinensis]